LDPKQYVKKDARFLRPAEPLHLVGNATKAKQLLQWQPQISFPELVKQMTEAELTSLGQIKKA